MRTTRLTAQRSALLPPAAMDFLRRSMAQLFGIALVGAGITLAACFLTYDPFDSSWNTASESPPHNLLQAPGAMIADLLLQNFGLASFLFVLVFLCFGGRIILHAPITRLRWRLVSLFVSFIALSIFLAGVPIPAKWAISHTLGGAAGDVILRAWLSVISRLGIVGKVLTMAAMAGIFIPTLFAGIGLKFRQLRTGLGALNAGTTHLRASASSLWDRYAQRREENPYDEINEDPRPKIHISADEAIPLSDEDPLDEPALEDHDLSYPHISTSSIPVVQPKSVAQASKTSHQDASPFASGTFSDYQLPSHELLDQASAKTQKPVDPQVLEDTAHHLMSVLEEFGVRGEIVNVRPGPVVTLYELKPAAGIKTSRVIGLADDIARSMSALSARIAVIPGRNVIGIELPNRHRETVYMRDLLQTEAYNQSTSHLPLILGKDIGGQPVIADLTRMPHLLVAGTTGSGKSVSINTMILSLLFRLTPDQCKFIMIDPKMLELSIYDDIPHLLAPVVTDPKKAVVALKWVVREMENRYRVMSKMGVRNIDGYNQRVREAKVSGELLVRRVQTGFDPDSGKPIFESQSLDLEPLPFIVVVVDEMADLMLVAGKEIEAGVQRLAQMARAAGIHLIMATQRPSVDVITGTIKANFPTRISFQVTSKIDSRTILGDQGAEQLLGQGDMLYMAGGGRITRVHGPFLKDNEVERIVSYLKSQGDPTYVESITEDDDETSLGGEESGGGGGDELYNQAVELVLREGKASTSFVQRHLQIGYNRAARIIELMEKNSIISAANHVGKREVIGR